MHLIYSLDGSRLIAAVGNRVLLYNMQNGDLIESLRGNFQILIVTFISNLVLSKRTRILCIVSTIVMMVPVSRQVNITS